MTTLPLDTARTPEPLNERALARLIAEELLFALQTTTLKIRQLNIPDVTTVTGTVTADVSQLNRTNTLLDEVVNAVLSSGYQDKEVQKVELTNPTEYPDFPEFPTDIAATLKDLPELQKAIKEVVEAINKKELTANLTSPEVKVEAPNLTPITNGLLDLTKQQKDNLKALKAIEAKKYPETNLKPLEKAIKAVEKAIDHIPVAQPERLPRFNNGNVAVTQIDVPVDTLIDDQGTQIYIGEFPTGTLSGTISYIDKRTNPVSIPLEKQGVWSGRVALFS